MAKKKTRKQRRSGKNQKPKRALAFEDANSSVNEFQNQDIAKQESIDWSSLLISSPSQLKSDLLKTLWVSLLVSFGLLAITWLGVVQ